MSRVNRRPEQFGIRVYRNCHQGYIAIPLHAVPPGADRASMSATPEGIVVRIGSQGHVMKPCTGHYTCTMPKEVLVRIDALNGSTPVDAIRMRGPAWLLPVKTLT
jgi:hypothetical protein